MPDPDGHTARKPELAGPPQTALDAILKEYGDRWRCWYARPTDTYYAIQADRQVRGAYQLRAETPATLREQLRHAETQGEDLPIIFLGAMTADNASISDRAADA